MEGAADLHYLFTATQEEVKWGLNLAGFEAKLSTHTFTPFPVESGLQPFTDCLTEVRTLRSLGHTAMVPGGRSGEVITYFHFTKFTVTTAVLFFTKNSGGLVCLFVLLVFFDNGK